jgi:hypothetical protein
MSWLVAAMEAGVLEGDMLTGIELSTGLVQGKVKAQHCKKMEVALASSILTLPSCAFRPRFNRCKVRVTFASRTPAAAGLPRRETVADVHLQISRAIEGILGPEYTIMPPRVSLLSSLRALNGLSHV